MNKVQWIAFRIIIQYFMLICGQLLSMADGEFGIKQYWEISTTLQRFYEKYDVDNEN